MIVQLILLQVGTLVVIIFILRQIFARHVNTALNNLQDLYQDNLKREEVLNEEIARTKTLREKEIARVKEEARQIIAQAKANAEEETQRLMQETEVRAEEQAKQMLQKANLQLDDEYRQMVQSLQDKIADFSETAIGYILSQKSKRILQDELTEELLRELGSIPKGQIQLKEPLNEVGITCAYPIDEPQKERIKKAVGHYLGRTDLVFNFKVDEAIIGGLILNFGGRIVDGSLHNRLRQALSKIETQQDLKFRPSRTV